MLYVQHYPQANGKLVAILRGATCTRHLYGTTLLAHQQFSRSFFEPNAVYLRFTCIAKHQPLFYIGSTEDHTLGREHTRYRKFKQVSSGQFVLSELAIRFWSHSNNFFWWSPVPLYIRRANHWALEHALIQLWQPKLNYPFISQFFIPRKGIISKIPYSNIRQFGIASLWRRRRYKTTGKALRNILNSPLFQNRVRMWALLQDLGSNTRRRFEQTQYIRSSAFSLEGCYALRRLGVHLPETHQKLYSPSGYSFEKEKLLGKFVLLGHLGCCPDSWILMYDKSYDFGILALRTRQYLVMNHPFDLFTWNTLHWWKLFATTRKLSKIGLTGLRLLAHVLF